MGACPRCGEENSERARFCQACGSALDAQLDAHREVRKTVTVVFCDVTGSTSLGERLDPESLQRVLHRYFDGMRAILERHGGTVEKFIGDAVMAVFGVPTLHEDDALRAVKAAAEMRDALASLNEELGRDFGVSLGTRTGVNTGEVMTVDAAGSSMTGAVSGDAVNVAARLEQAAAPGEILIGESTYRLVRDAVTVEAVPPLRLKGKAGPVTALRLLQVAPGAPAFARRLDSPMVGRERQLEQLLRAFDGAASERTCHLFTILGVAGVGKSRLVEEFVSDVEDRATVLRGRCLPYGDGITFWPVAEVVKQAAGVRDFDAQDAAVRRISEVLGGEERAELIADRVARAIGVAPGGAPAEETQWAVRRFVESAASARPLVVVFDDIHWGEPTFLDLIEHVADWTRDAAILLICMARPEFLDGRPGWGGGKLNASSVLLEPLTEEECRVLIGNLLGATQLVDEVRERIAGAAGGNPLFAEQMLSMLIDDGLMASRDGRWVATGDLSEIAVPPTIAALLAARLDRLPVEERAVVERASVVGKVFHANAVLDLSPEQLRPQVPTLLMSLVRKDLVRPDRSAMPGEEVFRFRHLLIRDAAYQAIPKQLRAELHERYALFIEGVAGERVEEQGEIVGYHLEQAFRNREELAPVGEREREIAGRAARRLAAAGARALGRADMPAAADLLSRAVSLLPLDDPVRIELLLDLGYALWSVGRQGEVAPLLDEAVERAEAAGDDRLRAHAVVQRWRWTGLDEANPDDAERDADWALGVFGRLGDARGLARASGLKRSVAWGRGRVGAETAVLLEALPHAREAGDAAEEAEILFGVGGDVVRGPTPVEDGIRLCEEFLVEYAGNPTIEAAMLHPLAHLRARRGEFEEALAIAERFRGFLLETGQRLRHAFFTEVTGDIYMLAGDPDKAASVMQDGYETIVEIGGPRDPFLGAFLGRALVAAGRSDEAEAMLESAAAAEELLTQALGKGGLARIRARQGRHEAAERLAGDAVRLLADGDMLIDQADVLMDLADVLALAGRTDGATDALRQALARYERKGDVVSTERVRALLAEG